MPIEAQLFIDDGTNGMVSVRNTSGGTLGNYDNTNIAIALFVDGNIMIEGTYDNQAAEVQLTGNISKSTAGIFTTSGDEVFVSAPNPTITTDMNQRISGAFTATTTPSVTNNEFNNLIVHKTATRYIDLAGSIEVKNTIRFTNSGRIRTDIAGHTNDGSAYPYEVYIKNGAANAIVGNSSGNGATEKYIEGKLRRRITSSGVYYFPVGVAPTSLDGMESFELNFSANPNTDFLGYIKPATIVPITRNILCDVGKDPGPGQQNFSGCVGSPDGIKDFYYLEPSLDLSHEWVVTPSGASGGYAYGITLHPGNLLDVNNATNYYTIPASCGTPYQNQRVRVITKDGIVGGDNQTAPSSGGNYAPFAPLKSYLWCQFDNADLDITLLNQTAFSSFRIHGTQLNSQTVLPVELISLIAEPINNTYVNVSWSTASELNNKGFEVLRSTDGIQYTKVGFVYGNGTTNLQHNYAFDDYDVQPEKLYYYKLKQIDLNETYKYSYIVSAKLTAAENEFSVSEIYPNPVYNVAYINIFAPAAEVLTYSSYNAIGQEIKNNLIHLQKGYNKVEINTSDLAIGTYIVRLNFSDNSISKKIIKK